MKFTHNSDSDDQMTGIFESYITVELGNKAVGSRFGAWQIFKSSNNHRSSLLQIILVADVACRLTLRALPLGSIACANQIKCFPTSPLPSFSLETRCCNVMVASDPLEYILHYTVSSCRVSQSTVMTSNTLPVTQWKRFDVQCRPPKIAARPSLGFCIIIHLQHTDPLMGVGI